jgi:hypothetical protein
VAGLLPFIIVAMVLTKRLRARLPLCDNHLYYWTWRTLFVLGGFLGVVVLGIGAIVLVALVEARRGAPNRLAPFVCFGVIGLGLVWLVAAAVIQVLTIRPDEITDHDITLVRVSREFADAVRAARRRRRADEEEYYGGRRRPRYEDEEDDYYER